MLNLRRALGAVAILLAVAGCATTPQKSSRETPSPHYKVGNPYKINGRWYRPAVDPSYDKTGVASWYGDDFHGRPTANGEIFDMRRMTAAHTTLPLPSMVEVTNLDNGRQTVVRVNDRGPFAKDRIIDLSRAAAQALGFENKGLANVRVRYLAPGPLPGEKTAPIYAKAKPVVEPVAVAATVVKNESATDSLASLIGETDPGRDAILPPPLPVLEMAPIGPQFYAIQVAVLDDIGELPAIRARLLNEGPMSIAREEGAAQSPRYRINLGPFSSESDATDRLETIREAGYDGAVVVPHSP